MDITDKKMEQFFINQERFCERVDEFTAYLKDLNENLEKFLNLLAEARKMNDEMMDDEMEDDEMDDESN